VTRAVLGQVRCGNDARRKPRKSPTPDFSTVPLALGNPAKDAGFPHSHSDDNGWITFTPELNPQSLKKPNPSKIKGPVGFSCRALFSGLPGAGSGFGDRIGERQLTVQLQSESKAYAIRLSAQQREMTISLPKNISVDKSKFSQHVVMVDVDCFTLKSVNPNVLVAPDFIRVSEKAIEDNIASLVKFHE